MHATERKSSSLPKKFDSQKQKLKYTRFVSRCGFCMLSYVIQLSRNDTTYTYMRFHFYLPTILCFSYINFLSPSMTATYFLDFFSVCIFVYTVYIYLSIALPIMKFDSEYLYLLLLCIRVQLLPIIYLRILKFCATAIER